MSLRINFYGGPGVGKSALAATTFGWLRQNRFNAELVQEWIKSWVYLGRKPRSFDYVYTFANQLHAEDCLLQAGVNILVTDSPVYLQCMYALHQDVQSAEELLGIACLFEKRHPSVNFFVERPQFAVYEQSGRYEDLGQAIEMDCWIGDCLRRWDVPFTRITPGDLDTVIKELNTQHAIRQGLE
jgi:hypothetical protein